MGLTTKVFATGMLLGVCSWASALPVLTVSAEGSAAAQAAQAAFLGSLQGGYLTEDFETGYTVGAQSAVITSTGIATFTRVVAGSGGACDNTVGSYTYSCDDGLAVLDSSVSPFSGRFSIPTDADNTNWLDSMDARQMSIDVDTGYNALGFFMTDPNDAGGRFDIGGLGFNFADIFGSSLGSGKQFYISIYDTDVSTLASVSVYSNASGDGYGIDQLTVGKVPEPGTLALLGLGLAGLGISRRRKHA